MSKETTLREQAAEGMRELAAYVETSPELNAVLALEIVGQLSAIQAQLGLYAVEELSNGVRSRNEELVKEAVAAFAPDPGDSKILHRRAVDELVYLAEFLPSSKELRLAMQRVCMEMLQKVSIKCPIIN